MTAPFLYLPVEETKRELPARLLLATIAAERGIETIIGQQWLMMQNLAQMPRGLILLKGNDKVQCTNMILAKRLGYTTASIEEEMFGLCTASEILRLIDAEAVVACDIFLAQGAFHKETLTAAFPTIANRVTVVGNARADILRDHFLDAHREAAAAIRAERGRFVLINTNFGNVNSTIGSVLDCYDAAIKVGWLDPASNPDRDDFATWCRWERLNFGAIVRFIDWMGCHHPEVPIVLRPHPSEDHRLWQRGYRDTPRVRIEASGVFTPWVMAADILVHTSCTTGLEAFLMDCPAVSLTPTGTTWHQHYLSNLVNPCFADSSEAGRFVAGHLAGHDRIRTMRPDFMAHLDRHLVWTDPRLASERMIEAITRHLDTSQRVTWQADADFVPSIHRNPRQIGKMNASLVDIEEELNLLSRTASGAAKLSARQIGDAFFHLTKSGA